MNDTDITVTEWYQELERAAQVNLLDEHDDGFKSSKEIGRLLGVSQATVRRYLDVFYEEGRLRHKDRRVLGKHGRVSVIPVYKVVSKEEAGGTEADGA